MRPSISLPARLSWRVIRGSNATEGSALDDPIRSGCWTRVESTGLPKPEIVILSGASRHEARSLRPGLCGKSLLPVPYLRLTVGLTIRPCDVPALRAAVRNIRNAGIQQKDVARILQQNASGLLGLA